MIQQEDRIDFVEPKPQAKASRRVQIHWPWAVTGLCAAIALGVLLASQSVYAWAQKAGQETVPAIAPVAFAPVAAREAAAAPVATPSPRAAPLYFPSLDDETAFITFEASPRVNILLAGVDARPEDTTFPRTDTIMLASWDQEAQTVDLLSLPRDLWVPVPHPQHRSTKINLVYSIGASEGRGGPLLKETVAHFLNQPVHYYVWVNFNGFVRVVDQIGGIDIYVPRTILDEKYPTLDYGYETFALPAGPHHLDGATALKYARTRTQDGDFNRIRRQQAVIEAVVKQVFSPVRSARLLLAAPDIARTVFGHFESDLALADFLRLAGQANASLRIRETLVIDTRLGTESRSDEGMYVLMPDRAQIRAIVRQFFQVTETALP